jgi:phage tail-like protein
MSAAPQRRYRFASAGQWAAGLATRVDTEALAATGALAPLAPYGGSAQSFASAGAYAPAATRDGTVFWRDGSGAVHRLEAGEAHAASLPAPAPLGKVKRMAAQRANLWLAAASLQCHDSEQLSRQFIVEFDCEQLLDFAADGRDGVWALVTRDKKYDCVHVDCAGYETLRFALNLADPVQLTWLAKPQRLVFLAAGGKRLHWFAPGQSTALFAVDIDPLRPCFTATHLGSDGRSRIVLAGLEHAAYGGAAGVLTLDGDGAMLGTLPLPSPATGIHASGKSLLVTTASALLRFSHDAAPGVAMETSCVFITPVLQSPLNDNPRRWLRVEASATLPPGTSLEICYASTNDPQLQEQAQRLANGPERSVARLRELLPNWQAPIVFRGAGQAAPLAAPLHDVRDPWLWVSFTLVAAPGAALPRLHRLDVLYPGLTLMEYLPSVYQRAEAEPGNFLRALVGVLETGTQELDLRIAAMGSMIDPGTAPPAWLDYVASWLGLPWDDALDLQQKRRLLQRADQLAAGRGTRAGLAALLDALMPGRYSITDLSAQHGFATLGGALPAILAGLPSSAMALNRKAILGKGRLTCPTAPPDPVTRLVGHVVVGITASAHERAAWEPWLKTLLADAMPVTARLHLRWRSPAAQLLDDRLDDDFTLGDAPGPHLGSDAVTGLARLPATNTGLRLR